MDRISSLLAAASGLVLAAVAPHPSSAATPILTTLVSFNLTDGAFPNAGLILDADGNLLGTTAGGGNQGCAGGCGTVFEIVKTNDGYSSSPTTLVSFDFDNGASPQASLIADASGNLFGTTRYGGSTQCGPTGCGIVFEIAKTQSGYASTPTILVSFNFADGAFPHGGLIIDADGNLFGTTYGGGPTNCFGGCGTVFEIAKTQSGYASAPTMLVRFNGNNGANPATGLIFDTDGNLFGTTTAGGESGYGTVFEIAQTKGGYADTPTTLVSFNGSNGLDPTGSLIFNKKRDLLGTTFGGGPYGYGTVFEIAKTKDGYADNPTTLVSFNGTNGASPYAGLIADARGNLFGTTIGDAGSSFPGTAFKLAKTGNGYATIPTILASFKVLNYGGTLVTPQPGALLADASGDLFGPAYFGGENPGTCYDGCGTVFQISGSGFTPLAFAGTPGSADCYGKSVLTLLRDDRNLDAAAQARGLDGAEALQSAISQYCRPLAP